MLTPNINFESKTILVTGSAGFIGANLVKELLKTVDGATIVGLDNLNDYYDVSIKEYRLKEIEKLAESSSSKWHFVKGNIADKRLIEELFTTYQFDIVVNLAAQAGVRYSITNPDVYMESNIIGFYNILEACRHSYDNGARALSILYMRLRLRYTAAIKKSRIPRTTRWTIPFRFMRQRKNLMSCSRTHIVSCITSRQRV